MIDMDLIIFVLMILAITSAFFALEFDKRIYAIISLEVSTISIGLILMYINAIYAGLFHLLIYTGVLTVLFAASANFLEYKEEAVLDG
ncbi:MAG: hypothetical protein INQ03_06375 [Candidatus Heimdallarchaeota archaeon]|nr:hypothetical protein [Candidatus Heimdallarchaeota archaeon]